MLPLLGRLSLADYRRLFLTWTLLLVDGIVRLFLRLVPGAVLRALDSLRLLLLEPAAVAVGAGHVFRSMSTHSSPSLPLGDHLGDLCLFWGFDCREFVVSTRDGYRLQIHRIQSTTISQRRRPVVLCWHGFMMSSDVWVAHPGGPQRNLAFVLADLGYDVWLGNVRGNKYACAHERLKPNDTRFWDFSLDDHALVDLPDTIDYILRETGVRQLSYIGFSQGTTIGFAALSMLPSLRERVNLFVALAPSMKPHGLSNAFISSAVKSSPELIFLLFGRRSLMSSVLFYQDMFAPEFFAYLIDAACAVLFKWRGWNMSARTKAVAYQHLYSLCSVKVMVHWFQIIREHRFQMYNDNPATVATGAVSEMDAEDELYGEQEWLSRKNSTGFDSTAPQSPVRHGTMQAQSRIVDDKTLMTIATSGLAAAGKRRVHHGQSHRSLAKRGTVAHFPARYASDQIEYRPEEDSDSGAGEDESEQVEEGHRPSRDLPIALFYGGSDTLLDMRSLLKGLRFPYRDVRDWIINPQEGRCPGLPADYRPSPSFSQDVPVPDHEPLLGHTVYQRGRKSDSVLDSKVKAAGSPVVYLKCVPQYEHLCFLWADSAYRELFPDVVEQLRLFNPVD